MRETASNFTFRTMNIHRELRCKSSRNWRTTDDLISISLQSFFISLSLIWLPLHMFLTSSCHRKFRNWSVNNAINFTLLDAVERGKSKRKLYEIWHRFILLLLGDVNTLQYTCFHVNSTLYLGYAMTRSSVLLPIASNFPRRRKIRPSKQTAI